jgi:hypothetical protein
VALGRDGSLYVEYFVDMWHRTPALPYLMLTRTAGAPLVVGIPLRLGGAVLAEVAMGLAYAASIVAFYAVADRIAGRRVAIAFAVVLLAYVPYGLLFHTLSSDAPFALAFALWCWLLVRAVDTPQFRAFAILGVATGLLILIRPPSGPLVLGLALPLLVGQTWRARLRGAAAFALATAVIVVGFEAYNDARYGEFTVSRSTNATFPFYGVFTADKLVSPNNGPASRALAAAVKSDLLTRQPYKAYGITLDRFFSSGSIRAWSDLVTLSDRKWGWQSDYTHLRSVAVEAIERHPGAFAHDVFTTVRTEMAMRYVQGPPHRQAAATSAAPAVERVKGRALPVPSEGDIIPASRQGADTSTPDNSIRWDWSNIESPHPIFSPAEQRRNDRLHAETAKLTADLPNRAGSPTMAKWLNRISNHFPSMTEWLIVGLLGLLPGRRRRALVTALLAGLALVVVVITAAATPATPQYRVPFDPVFILFGLAAIARLIDVARTRIRGNQGL